MGEVVSLISVQDDMMYMRVWLALTYLMSGIEQWGKRPLRNPARHSHTPGSLLCLSAGWCFYLGLDNNLRQSMSDTLGEWIHYEALHHLILLLHSASVDCFM